MATPTLTRHTLPGALGEILIDVRAGGRASPRAAVVVIPGFKGFKDWGMFPPLGERLAAAGFTAVSLNPSGSGVDDSGEFVWPERFGHNTFSAEQADVAAVLGGLAAGAFDIAPPTRIGLVGHSRGGGAAILTAARDARVRALVTWAAISTVERWTDRAELDQWRAAGRLDVINSRTGQVLPLYLDVLDDVERHAHGALDIVAAAAQITAPWLLIHGTDDPSVPFIEAERLARAQPAARFVPVEGAAHTFGAAHPWRGSTPALDLVMTETVSWLSRHLL
ncbi:MAG TPA: alpha/beta fold hydrolase [Gemmatimonadales bacterium]|nr:alpha/beta fold hydrolase [Gemmatimonadales bacterium]